MLGAQLLVFIYLSIKEERDTLKQVTAMLTPLQNKLSTMCAQSTALGHIGSGSMTKRKHSEVFHR